MSVKIWKFEVESRHRFPLDMLRYDNCYPNNGDSVQAMYDSFDRVKNDDGSCGPYLVMMTAYSEPTVGRWQSFGWSVSNITSFRR